MTNAARNRTTGGLWSNKSMLQRLDTLRRTLVLVAMVGAIGIPIAAKAVPLGYVLTGTADPGFIVSADLASATVSVSAGSGSTGSGSAGIDYYYEVVSTTGVYAFSVVPVQIFANLSTSFSDTNPNAYNTGQASASVNVSGSVTSGGFPTGYPPQIYCTVPATYCTPSYSDVFTTDATAVPGFYNRVGVRAFLYVNSPTASGSAMADPYLQIDPAFHAAHPEYELVISPNVANTPVPEPAAGWLLGSGLLGLAGLGRRKRVP